MKNIPAGLKQVLSALRGSATQFSSAGTRLPEPLAVSYTRSGESMSEKKKRPAHEGFTWMGSIWLVYSIFFLVDPLQRHSIHHWIALAVVYPVFLAVYYSVYVGPNATTHRLLVAFTMFLLGMGYLPVNQSSGGIVVYAAAYLPFLTESVPLILSSLVAGSILIMLEAWRFHLTLWCWLPILFISFIVTMSNLTVARQKRADGKLRMAHEEIEHLAKVAERERIARDLHDVLGHTLSVIVLKSELAGRLLHRDPARTARELADVEQIARKALAEVREAIGGYRSEGLIAEIERAHKTLEAAGVELKCESKPPQLNTAEETVLSLVLREAVTNIVRHAGARHCDIAFSETERHYAVVVRDDGRGGVRAEGNGLRGMRQRVEALGGRFSVGAGEGTQLNIELPVACGQAAATQAGGMLLLSGASELRGHIAPGEDLAFPEIAASR